MALGMVPGSRPALKRPCPQGLVPFGPLLLLPLRRLAHPCATRRVGAAHGAPEAGEVVPAVGPRRLQRLPVVLGQL